MPRQKNEATALLSELKSRLDQLVSTAREQGRTEALEEIRSLVGGAAAPAKRGPGRPRKSTKAAKPGRPAKRAKKARKSSWAGLTPEQKLARVNAIRKGRGLPLKDKL